ncbi:choline ABC transporter permease subunit, partial [Vibrio coralliirubri]
MNFITENKIPVGQWMEAGVDWLTINAAGFFDAISIFLETVIMFLVDVFKWMPPALPIVITAA